MRNERSQGRSTRHRPAEGTLWLVTAALFVLGTLACSDAELAGGTLQRPAITHVGSTAAPPVAIASFAPSECAIDAARHERIRVGSHDFSKLYGRAHKRVLLRVEPSVRGLNRVVVPVVIDRDDRLELCLWRGEERVLAVEAALRPSTLPELVTIDLPLGAPVEFDALSLTIAGEGPAAIGTFDLVVAPIEARLPGTPDAPELIALGDETGRGFGLSTRHPIEVRFVATPGDVLSFSYGIPWHLFGHVADNAPTLVLELRRGERVHTFERFPLATKAAPPNVWHAGRIALAGGEWTARFRLEAKGGVEGLCALGEPKVFTPAAEPRTVLFVTSDTHRADHLAAAHSGVQVETPALDALAARGILFERCFSTTNVTLPSHVALLTGVHPRDTRLLDNATRLADTATTLAERFREAGFATVAAVSASHLASGWSGLGQGFDRVLETREHKRRGARTIDALERVLPDMEGQPLFVWLHLFDAHMPYEPPEALARRYYPDRARAFDAARPDPPIDARLIPALWAGLRDLEYPSALYRGEVSALDVELARLLSLPRFTAGIVAVTADHGESLGAHGVWFDHGQLYPDSIHVPLIVCWPGAPAGERSSTRISHLGLGRTLLDLAGVEEAAFPGENLLAARASSEDVYTLSACAESASLTSGRWHLMLMLERSSVDQIGLVVKARHSVELYDLDSDPGCTRDVARSEHSTAKSLRERLIAWLAASRPKPWRARTVHDPETLAQLARLGYVDSAPEGDEPLFLEACACERCAPFE